MNNSYVNIVKYYALVIMHAIQFLILRREKGGGTKDGRGKKSRTASSNPS